MVVFDDHSDLSLSLSLSAHLALWEASHASVSNTKLGTTPVSPFLFFCTFIVPTQN